MIMLFDKTAPWAVRMIFCQVLIETLFVKKMSYNMMFVMGSYSLKPECVNYANTEGPTKD